MSTEYTPDQTGESVQHHGSVPPVVANTLSEQGVRDFIDPLGKYAHEPIGTLVDVTAANRYAPIVSGLGQLAAHEVILAEATSMLLSDGSGIALPITVERQQEIITGVERNAGKAALAIVEVADDIHRSLHLRAPSAPSRGRLRIPNQLLVSGKVIAALAHHKAPGQTNRDFFTYADESASVLSRAWRRRLGDSQEELLDMYRFLIYADDAPENTIHPNGRYLESPTTVTPLVAANVLETQRIEHARPLARTLTYLIRNRDIEGDQLEYRDYLDRGIDRAGMPFLLTKSAGIQRNLNIELENIRPDDEKTLRKFANRGLYRDEAQHLMVRADESADRDLAWVAHMMFSVTRQDVLKESVIKYQINRRAAAQEVSRRVLAALVV